MGLQLALVVVAAAGLFLVALGAAALWRPPRARAFLLGFAATPGRHVLELIIRLVVGWACVVSAPRLSGTGIFQVAGWVLLLTTALLCLVPWRWHRRFAEASVPRALRFLPLLGGVSLAGGLAILAALWANLAI